MKRLSQLVLWLFFASQPFAQNLIISKKDGSTIEVAVADVTKILISSQQPRLFTLNTTKGTIAQIPVALIAKITFGLASGIVIGPETALDFGTVRASIVSNRSGARIGYAVARQSLVEISVFDFRGRLVRALVRGKADPGYYSVSWNSMDNAGTRARSGTYIITIAIAGKSVSKNFVVVN